MLDPMEKQYQQEASSERLTGLNQREALNAALAGEDIFVSTEYIKVAIHRQLTIKC